VSIEYLHHFGKVGQRPSQAIDLVDDYHIDSPRFDIREQLFERRPLYRGARESAVVIGCLNDSPPLAGLALDVCLAFAYDPFGRRSAKTINSSATQFLYDLQNPIQELQSGSPSANMLTGLGIDEYFSRTDSSGSTSFLTDILGSTLALTDSGGNIATNYTYDPFGAVHTAGASNTNSQEFTGRDNDGTGLYSFRDRYYSPSLQRFASQDPEEFINGLDLYDFVENDPADLTDPSGDGFLNCAKQLAELTTMMYQFRNRYGERMACPENCRDKGHKKAINQLLEPLKRQFNTTKNACKGEVATMLEIQLLSEEYDELVVLCGF
jgi:RHS repeat-associated protein